jgi:AmmeMemoRadiSam system protein B
LEKNMLNVRPPAVAGFFYPAEPETLSREVAHYLAAAKEFAYRPKAVIAPHAGYIYSAPIAASAYRLLKPLRGRIERVVLLGPAHRVWVNGMALPGVAAFETPLGTIPLDLDAISGLADLPQVETLAAAHAQEHSLEVQLPFLQQVLGTFKLVPLVVGGATPAQVAEVLERLWGGDETLIVVSSDLSHYLPYQDCSQVDKATAQAILDMRSDLAGEQACGAHPLNGLMLAARHHGLMPHLLDLRNSGDTAGGRDQVVGYGAFALTELQ